MALLYACFWLFWFLIQITYLFPQLLANKERMEDSRACQICIKSIPWSWEEHDKWDFMSASLHIGKVQWPRCKYSNLFFVKTNMVNTVDLLCIPHKEMTFSQFLWRVSRFRATKNGRMLPVIFVKMCDWQTFLLEVKHSMNIILREFFKF